MPPQYQLNGFVKICVSFGEVHCGQEFSAQWPGQLSDSVFRDYKTVVLQRWSEGVQSAEIREAATKYQLRRVIQEPMELGNMRNSGTPRALVQSEHHARVTWDC